ncbi:MAG: hypothetical protein Q9209_000542 [Squamulea sp. 1 TL-2023]
MPPATKKRKVEGVATTRLITSAPSKQQSIQTFGKISKSQAGRPTGKSKAKPNKEPKFAVSVQRISEQPRSTGRKRKLRDHDENLEAQDVPQKRTRSSAKEDTLPNNARPQEPTITKALQPATPRKQALLKSSVVETPTKGACSYLDSLNLSSSPSSEQHSSHSETRAGTPASSPPPESEKEADLEVPEEVQDLIDLQSSFLTALSLHYVHHGSLTPVDIRLLRPNIERSWRKRRVSVQDIQRILAFHDHSPLRTATLSLSDYGQSKVCIEISTPPNSGSQHKRPLNEELVNKVFVNNLLDQWKTYKTSHHAPISLIDFLNSLPLAPITPCVSATTLAPLLAKGQRRLEDLKAGAIKAQARSSPPNPSNKENVPPQAVDSTTKQRETLARKTSLFDRIKAKQETHLLSTANSTPLTPEQVLRQRALRRLEEIIPVLELLGSSGSSAIKSFTMPMVVQHLQMSLRNPIEKEEAVRAVKLLAEEVAPGWVGVKHVGKLVGVTVRKGGMLEGREAVRRTVTGLVNGSPQ